ncbi:hypothetical protein [Rhizobium hidalgonense]|uniref:Wadjet protein JetD C-terminal domain-containing protein n=1 Tax=Rhizobium hidalgonense TaxID=1538159 RepID=A0ABX4JZY0_9HYPH|nr:hypothetical protein [Rhizobium hidalgonense]PDT24453.1 hypothetical protein CO674_07150 [Rhizobium hidalgonense]PON04844.1 hypothetical protein ATY29_25640 [Rhizobium hidalgonense]
MTELYRARTIKRERRTRASIDQLDKQILEVLLEDHPQSVRHVFYRMTNPRLPESVEKSDRGYRHVQDRMVKLRRSGRLPFNWVTDATRRGYHTQTFRGSEDFLRRMKGLYRADLWRLSDYYCEVWVESRSIAGVIEGDCRELAVSLYPAGGFSSITLAYEAADAINAWCEGKPVVIYYIGDFDPAGVLIDQALERELRQHLNPSIQLYFIRLGITLEQIAQYDLPTKPRKEGDRRALHVASTVEAEAMPAYLMRELLRSNIESLLPANALRIAHVEEESARKYFETLAEITGGAA